MDKIQIPFMIFYDLDNSKVLDQIYGCEKYLGHTSDDNLYCLVTNFYGIKS